MGFCHISMQMYLYRSDIRMDGWASHVAVGRASIEASDSGCACMFFLLCSQILTGSTSWLWLVIEVQHIPGGYTGLCQSVDVRATKPLKDELGNQWESWIIEEEDVHDGMTTTDLARWEHIYSGTTPPLSKSPCGRLKHYRASTPKQYGVIRTLVGFRTMQRRLRYVSLQTFMIRSCLPYLVCHPNIVCGNDQGLDS